MGLEVLSYSKSNKLFPTYVNVIMQKIWNKVRQMQEVTGFARYSPIWDIAYYGEMKLLQYGAKWRQYGIMLLSHAFENGKLCSFTTLQSKF